MNTSAFNSCLCALFLVTTSCATERASSTNASSAAISLQDFKLAGDLHGDRATFTLTGTVHVENRKGGTLELLSGLVALTDAGPQRDWQLRAEHGRYYADFERRGRYPVTLRFDATTVQSDGWFGVEFETVPATPQPITLRGLSADTRFRFTGAARPERKGDEFVSYLPSDGAVRLSWKESRREEEGKLFYAAEMLSQISVGPGLMRQVALLDFKVMQGELDRVSLRLHGPGEVTRVQGDKVLSWRVEKVAPESDDRRLIVQLNQLQKESFALQVQMQTPLGAFPQTTDAIRLQPEGATRFDGYFRVVNDGAVRLDVVGAKGLSQTSPEQFPVNEATRALLQAGGSQQFVYRFSSADSNLRIQAGQIVPEIAVSQILAYHHGENELAIDAEFDLDIREAPLRELLIHVPVGYAVARLNAPGMNDYFLRDRPEGGDAGMRIVYSQPISGRQVIQLRLERNQALGSQNWALPRVEVVGAKSVRGNIGVSADTGFRLTPERTQGLTEIATAFFPRKLAGLQTGFRLSEPAWQATMRVERLPQTVQADAFNLFSIGEGIAYGSTVMNFLISGAPISAFQVELSDEYFNVEFIGKEIRTWQKTTNGYMVQLHAPVSGAYVLLATYERPFKPQGETLLFTGARPRDAQTEQGYTIVISAHQFQVKPVQVSQGLLPLEPGEVPAEYRLFFDAPILAAYRYTSRPFDLRLALSPLAQGDSLSQVVDRASLVTRISKEGQAVTDVAYLVKNRGNPNLRISLPANTELWSATVNGAPVVPVKDGNANLIPLPQHADPDAVLKVELKLAAKSPNPSRVRISAPIVDKAPVMLAEWKVQPDTGQRLIYRKGSLTPPGGVPDVSGFGVLARLFGGGDRGLAVLQLLVALGLLAITLALWRWLIRERVARFSGRHLAGLAFGVVALLVAAFSLAQFVMLADGYRAHVQPNLALVAPIQQSGGDLHVEVANVPATTGFSVVRSLWPVLAVVVIWIIGRSRLAESFKPAPRILCWTLLAWVVLQLANGVPWFIGIVCAFFCLDLLIPLLRQLWTLPSKELPPLGSNAASAGTAILTGSLLLLSLDSQTASAADAAAAPAIQSIVTVQDRQPSPLAQSVAQEIRVEDGFAMATAKIRWRATKGQELPVLFGPAVVTRITFPSDALKSGQTASDDKRIYQLTALQSGTFEIELEYQLRVATQDAGGQFELPTQFGLVNPVKLTVVGRKVDVFSAQAASVQGETSGTNTVVTLALSPVNGAIISWKPRSRDVAREKPVYYAELTQLYIPSAGVIEGVHLVSIRPAQGELPELTLDVPPGATITDVTGSTLGRVTIDAATGTPVQAKSLIVSVWRFDPDTRKLRVTLNPAQSKPFALVVRSQVATGPLPFEHKVGLLSVEGTSGQIGFLGVATGNEVQLDSVSAEDFSPINLEDFPSETVRLMAAPIPGLTVRRAYRFTAVKSMAMVKASAVEPDVRVETQDTLSLGEDRIVLASSATVDITRAGIFRLSFIMPDGFDVDSITGPALSHWADQKTDAGRLITLNLKGKTEGRQQFTISLAGPGFRATNNWSVPRVVLREASKQQGTYLIVPEQGMQLQASGLDNVSQLDPQRAGIRQKGVLAFRVLQSPWKLVVQVEQVDSWVQVTSLQHATVNEAQVKVAVNLQYQIENTGLKLLRVFIPTNAESVRFVGEHVSDFLPVAGAVTNGLQEWEIKLQRRIIGQYLLQATYQTPLPAQTPNTTLLGVQAADVNLQRGYVTVQSSGRLQVRVDSLPTGLQPIEWQSIPRGLQQNLQADAANFAYRLVEPSFQLPLNLDRHEATRLLPARVNSITFDSVISDAGVMLTQVRLEMLPGDKRLLYVNLPKDAKFWFAFVNRSGVWPWRDQDEILIPLEPQSRGGKPVPVEFFYSSQVGKPGSHAIDLTLLAPKFDLPLENITWRVYLGEKWQVKHWTGNLQLQQEQLSPVAATLDFDTYLKSEANLQKEKTQEAEQMLALGNTALERGDPQQARRAFQAAFGLSTHDNAFNEDARVQLHNLKLQQALVGLNVRQAAAAGDGGTISSRFREMRGAKNLNYTQQDAKEILDRNTSDDNAAYVRLAEKLIQQQDAAVTSPSAIRANIPEQGRRLTFHRSVAVDKDADLRIGLNATISRSATWTARVSILLGTLVVVGLFVRLGGGRKRVENARPGLVA